MPDYRRFSRSVKGGFDEAQMMADLGRLDSQDLWAMLETNLRHICLAWEGCVPERVTRQRASLCLCITRTLRVRGEQLPLSLL